MPKPREYDVTGRRQRVHGKGHQMVQEMWLLFGFNSAFTILCYVDNASEK